MIAERRCQICDADMTGKRRHAVYCSRSCKTKASDQRRTADGRARVRDRRRYEQEADHRRAYALEYLRRFPVKSKEFRLRRRARLQAATVYRVTERDWLRLLDRYRHACAYCGVTGVPLTRDHLIPLARGGQHRIGNIVPACGPCNFSKHTAFLVEFRFRKRRRAA